jgi:hypothetical protein
MLELTTLVEIPEGSGRIIARMHVNGVDRYDVKPDKGDIIRFVHQKHVKKIGGTLARKDRHGNNIPAGV